MYHKEIKTGPVIHIAISMWVFKQIQLYLDYAGCWYRISDLDFWPVEEWPYVLLGEEFHDKNAVMFETVCEKQIMQEMADEIFEKDYAVEDIPGGYEYRDITIPVSNKELAEQFGEHL